jgi:hypothetical protein
MKDKLKANMLDNSRIEKKPVTKQPVANDDDDDYNDGDDFEKDDDNGGEDQLEKLRKAMEKEK